MEVDWKLEMENGNGNWKRKLEMEMEMRQSLARGIAHVQGRYCARHRVPRGDGTVWLLLSSPGLEPFPVTSLINIYNPPHTLL